MHTNILVSVGGGLRGGPSNSSPQFVPPFWRRWCLAVAVLLASCLWFTPALAQQRLNVNFGSGTKVGHAAPGTSTNELWNTLGPTTTVSSNYNGTAVLTYSTFTNLVWSTGSNAPVTVSITNLTATATNTCSDAMMGSYLKGNLMLYSGFNYQTYQYVMIYGDPKIVVTGLPAGSYDFYFYGLGASSYYGYNGDMASFRVQVGGGGWSSWKATTHPGTVTTNWQEGQQYVRFSNVSVGEGETLTVNIGANQNYHYLVNGMQIISRDGNVPPSVSLTSPVNGTQQFNPAFFTLTAEAGDSDGTIDRVEFYQGTNLLSSITNAPYRYDWTNISEGTYTLTAKAYDNIGASTNSAAATVTVVAPFKEPINQYLITDLGRGKAFSINNRGQVVGESYSLQTNLTRPFLWTPNVANGTNGSLIDVAGTNGARHAWAVALNNQGQVVGNYELSVPEVYSGYNGGSQNYVWRQYGFQWTPTSPNAATGSFRNLGTIQGAVLNSQNSSTAVGIGEYGRVVGDFTDHHLTYFAHVAIWDEAGAVDFSAGAGMISRATAINESGITVGYGMMFNGNVSAFSDHAVI